MAHIKRTIKKSIVFCVVITFFTLLATFFTYFILHNKVVFMDRPDSILWFLFAFISGVFMIGSRTVYPVALHLTSVPASTKKSYTSIKLMVFGLASAFLIFLFGAGLPGISQLKVFDAFDFNTISFQLYVLFGFFAYIISLSNLNIFGLQGVVLVKNIKTIIKEPKGLIGVFILTLIAFFTEIIPATWLLFLEAGLNRDVLFGVSLLLAHFIGRVFFVSLLSALSRFGINSTSWLIEKKDSFRDGLSTVTIVFSTILIQIGLSSLSLSLFGENAQITNIVLDGWVFLLLLVTPLWISFFREEDRVYGTGEGDIYSIKEKIQDLENESHTLEVVNKHNNPDILKKISRLINKIEELRYISKILESSLRHGATAPLRTKSLQEIEERELRTRLIGTIFITFFAITFVSIFLAS